MNFNKKYFKVTKSQRKSKKKLAGIKKKKMCGNKQLYKKNKIIYLFKSIKKLMIKKLKIQDWILKS